MKKIAKQINTNSITLFKFYDFSKYRNNYKKKYNKE